MTAFACAASDCCHVAACCAVVGATLGTLSKEMVLKVGAGKTSCSRAVQTAICFSGRCCCTSHTQCCDTVNLAGAQVPACAVREVLNNSAVMHISCEYHSRLYVTDTQATAITGSAAAANPAAGATLAPTSMSATLVETAEEDSYVVVVQYVADLLNEGQVTASALGQACMCLQTQSR